MEEMIFDVYGQARIRVARRQGEWVAEQLTGDGKRRRLDDVVIPPGAAAEEIADLLEVLFHESGRPGAGVRLVEE